MLPLYNEFRLGRYYNALLDGFRETVIHSLSDLISYFSSLKYLEQLDVSQRDVKD